MSFITDIPQTGSDHEIAKEKASKLFLERLTKLSRSFWQYTEETGETNTKPYEGLI